MGAQMNIKNAEASAIAAELAVLCGTSVTQVVLDALRAHRRKLCREAKIEELMEFARETAAMLSPDTLAFDINKELYDEATGMPK